MKVEFYADSQKKIIHHDLFSNRAEALAKEICQAGLNNKGNKLEKNKSSQIRKFYDEVLRFSDFLKAGEDYKSILPYIKMLNAKAAYAEGRKLVTSEFKSFIKQSLDHLTESNPQAFEVFLSFFEAFMGYYKFEESKYKG